MVNIIYDNPDAGLLDLRVISIPLSDLRLNVVLVLLVLSLILPAIFWRNLKDKDGHSIPPGPLFRYPVIRNYPEHVLRDWSKTYGPLFSLWMGDQLFIVISDARIAKDLLVSNGAIFSSCKSFFVKHQTIFRGLAITGTPYSDKWRQHRKIVTQLFNPKAIEEYASVFDYEARILVRSMYFETKMGTIPIDPSCFVGCYTLNNILTIAFATRTYSTLDPLTERVLSLAKEYVDVTGALTNVVDFIKPLQWIPTTTRSCGRRIHDEIVKVCGVMVDRVKARMDAGKDVPDCLVKTLMLTQEQEKIEREDMYMLFVAFTLGSISSTAGTIMWFLARMTAHPEIQARAHAELDKVVGRDHWPAAKDEQRLPYIRAIIKEVMRCHAPFLLPAPHLSTEDFVYNGMYIPKNAAVIMNCYDIHHNEERYPDAFTFNPDRYLDDTFSFAKSSMLPNAMDRDHWAFGAGYMPNRHICPGIHFAERALWLAISRLLWAYEIHSLPDEPISLEEYAGKNVCSPLPYRVTLTPRNEQLQLLVEGEQEITLMKL